MAKDASKNPRVEVVILNWNGGSMNRTCLDALYACGYSNLGILFVDNGSEDGSPEDVKARYADLEVLCTGENLGFTGGNNFGLRKALEREAEMVLILNNDVEVTHGFLDPLVERLKAGTGIAGPKILLPDGRVWCTGGMLTFHQNLTKLRGFGQVDNGRYDREEAVDYMPACCLLISREVLDHVGFLDEDYFCYLEDVDFCLRARKAGYPVTYVPESRVYHHFSHSTGGGYSPARKYMNALNSVRFLRKHGTAKSWFSFWMLDVFSLPFVFAAGLFQGRTKGVLAKGRGIAEGLAGGKVTPGSLDRYKKE